MTREVSQSHPQCSSGYAEPLDVRIFVDSCTDEIVNDVEYVRDTYLPTAQIYRANKHINVLSGTWNILQALKSGWETGAEYVCLVEEDVFVRPDFFQKHLEMQEGNDLFVSCGRRCGRMPLDFFSNPGSMYKRDKLALVLSHINDTYFSDPAGYLKKYFPSMDGMDGPLDDGLIRKIIRSVDGKVRCAEPRICSHVGFRYYDRLEPYINKGQTIQERIQKLRELLPAVRRSDQYAGDFEYY